MADISSVALAAKCSAKIAFKPAVAAIRSTIGDATSPNFHHETDRMHKNMYTIVTEYVNDPLTLSRKAALKDEVNLSHVQDMASKIMLAATLPDAATPATVDEDIVSYAINLIFIPIWERTGHLSAANAQVQTNEEMALAHMKEFVMVTGGSLTVSELTHQTTRQASDPIDPIIGSLPNDMAHGLRRACVQGFKELQAHEPELVAAIKNHRPIPTRFNAHPLAAKYALSLLLRMIAPVIAHRLKGHNLFVSVASVLDVCLASNPRSPLVIVIEEKRERPTHDGPAKKQK